MKLIIVRKFIDGNLSNTNYINEIKYMRMVTFFTKILLIYINSLKIMCSFDFFKIEINFFKVKFFKINFLKIEIFSLFFIKFKLTVYVFLLLSGLVSLVNTKKDKFVVFIFWRKFL